MTNDHQNQTSTDANLSHQYQAHPISNVGILPGQQTKPEGLDYTLQRSGDVYSSMITTNRTHLQPANIGDRRAPNPGQVYATYDQTSAQSHSLNYGATTSPASNLGASNTLSQMSKAANTAASNSPPQSTWTPRHLTRVFISRFLP